jgi:hypothetical protein
MAQNGGEQSVGRWNCGNPAACENCFWAYPRGCLHTLQESERNSPLMNQFMHTFNRYTDVCDSHQGGDLQVAIDFWDRPEYVRFGDKNMVRNGE